MLGADWGAQTERRLGSLRLCSPDGLQARRRQNNVLERMLQQTMPCGDEAPKITRWRNSLWGAPTATTPRTWPLGFANRTTQKPETICGSQVIEKCATHGPEQFLIPKVNRAEATANPISKASKGASCSGFRIHARSTSRSTAVTGRCTTMCTWAQAKRGAVRVWRVRAHMAKRMHMHRCFLC